MTVTNLKGEKRELASSLIMELRKVPDTVVVLSNGSCLPVKESLEDVIALFMLDKHRPSYLPPNAKLA